MLAHGDSYRDLENIDDYPPHVPFIELTETNNPAFQGTLTGLTPLTDAAILIRGDLRIFQPDYFLIAARKGDIVALYTTLFQPQFQINETYPFGGFANSDRFFTKFIYTAPATSEYVFSIGGNGNVGSYELGLAIIPNKPVVADFSLSASSINVGGSVSVSDASYDPEEKVTNDGPNGIIQRQWSNGATSRTTSFTFSSPGIHTISVTVTSNDGETASISRTVEVVDSNPNPVTGKLSSLQFTGSAVPILPDPGTTNPLFTPGPGRSHYEDANQDGEAEQRHPILYAAGSVPEVDATFVLPATATGSYLVRGRGTDDLYFEGSASVSNGKLEVDGMQAKAAFGTAGAKSLGAQVKKYESFTIDWELSSNGGSTWTTAGQSSNTLYVSAATPLTQHPFETVVELAVSNAFGATALTQNAIIDGIWSDFTDRVVRRIDGNPLHYYGDPATGGLLDLRNYGTIELLRDGTGQCGAWVNLLLDVLAVHGIVNTEHAWIEALPRSPYEEMLIQTWTFPASGSLPGTAYPYRLQTSLDLIGTYVLGGIPQIFSEPRASGAILPGDITDANGIAGQSTANPLSVFANHQVAVINGMLYDPSYGTKYANTGEFEANVAAFGIRDYLIVAEADVGRDLDGDAVGSVGYLSEVFEGSPLLVRKENPLVEEVWISHRQSYIPASLPFTRALEAASPDVEIQMEVAFTPVALGKRNFEWTLLPAASTLSLATGKGDTRLRLDASSGAGWFGSGDIRTHGNPTKFKSCPAEVLDEDYANAAEVGDDKEGVAARDSAILTWDSELWDMACVWDMSREFHYVP